MGFITSPKHGVPGVGCDGAWRGAGWPGGPTPLGATPRAAPFRSPSGWHRCSPLRRGKGGGKRSAVVGQPRRDEAARRSGPAPRGRAAVEGVIRRDGGRALRWQEGTASPAQVPGGSNAYWGCTRPGAAGEQQPHGTPARALRGQPAGPAPAADGEGGRGAVRGRPCGALSPRLLPGCGLRAIFVCWAMHSFPANLSLSAPPLLLFPFSYLLFTPLFLAFPWNSCRLFPDTSIPPEGSSWRQFCAPRSLGDAPHQTRARLVKEVPQPPLPFQSIPETSSGALRVTSSM